MKSYEYYEEEDYIVEPRVKGRKKKKEEDDWYYPFEDNVHRHKVIPRMAYNKKRELEEYNLQRKSFYIEQQAQVEARKHLELHNVPRDIIDEILKMAGFYIPYVCVYAK